MVPSPASRLKAAMSNSFLVKTRSGLMHSAFSNEASAGDNWMFIPDGDSMSLGAP